ncbi:phosphonate C-P lyase system protein PhnG [Pseudomonas aeruginosa]|uniref:phosphonate C-P lyase system protein PhnG n=1 Tax=Pseudomonadaceae TaxID=135621 RepID=UPI00197DA4A6|nr:MULTISPECIES: phosphonate C-P lyase system protein PhnG [Pseudomonas]MCV0280550.1 phosphonate C-P lyase system protein PhnG [Pseudomonas aeruginosa]MDH1624273.1 phosphonate C-P lyase system protein PhnG [Pseudomonas chengduensis]
MSRMAQQERTQWLGLLSRADCAWLEQLWLQLEQHLQPRMLAGPETGMLRLTTQASGSPVGFQFGEATCSRCVVEIGLHRGYAVQLGSDLRKAQLSACLDALFQGMAPTERAACLEPISLRLAEQQAERERLVAATRVHFYTTKTSGAS